MYYCGSRKQADYGRKDLWVLSGLLPKSKTGAGTRASAAALKPHGWHLRRLEELSRRSTEAQMTRDCRTIDSRIPSDHTRSTARPTHVTGDTNRGFTARRYASAVAYMQSSCVCPSVYRMAPLSVTFRIMVTAEPIEMPFGELIHMGPRNRLLDGMNVGRFHSSPKGVRIRQCGISSKFFGYLFRVGSANLSVEISHP